MAVKKLASYKFKSEDIPVKVDIYLEDKEFVPKYYVEIPGIGPSTMVLLRTKYRAELLERVELSITDILDPKRAQEVKELFKKKAYELLKEDKESLNIPNEEVLNILVSYLIHYTIGLGELEILLADDRLEEIVINSASPSGCTTSALGGARPTSTSRKRRPYTTTPPL